MSAWVLLLDTKDSIHWGHEGRLDAPFLECYGAPSLERRFLERRHLCRHGFCYSIQKTLSTGDTKEDSMHLFWSAMERPTLVQYRKIEGHRLRF